MYTPRPRRLLALSALSSALLLAAPLQAQSVAPARSQVVMLGPGMRQLRALLPTDPGFPIPTGDQNVGSVDSPDEMGQG